MFPYKSIPPQTQPEKAAVQGSFEHEVKPNGNEMITELKKYEFREVNIKTKKNDLHFRDLLWPIIPTYLLDLSAANLEALEYLWDEWRHERIWLIWVVCTGVSENVIDMCMGATESFRLGKIYLYFYCNPS